ncbi:hypothetical protein [Lacrimispora celerecrescens]|uniref:hypothetical protein n=1 Tax=Lacrimispora celerecrescens TaxID=29354 RepID=UPI001FA6D93A|nr:hypothetical protein [Lacrimispora celerecrescens]
MSDTPTLPCAGALPSVSSTRTLPSVPGTTTMSSVSSTRTLPSVSGAATVSTMSGTRTLSCMSSVPDPRAMPNLPRTGNGIYSSSNTNSRRMSGTGTLPCL